MKKLFTLIAAVMITATTFAQAPSKMSYQAVVRDASSVLVTNQAVGMQVSILQGSFTGTPVYVETHSPSTNINGLVSIEIGAGTVVSGIFNSINWGNGPYFIKTETDPTGGSNYTISGTSQLLSVPYALHANIADSVIGGGAIGPQGPIGLTGPQGPQGIAGAIGPQGPMGPQGLKGDTGVSGPQGPIGLTGPQGPQGLKGDTGLLSNGAAAGNTPYWNGSNWVVNNSNIHNNGIGIGINTSTPDASAQLDIESTTKGFLPPRMTDNQRNAIANPAVGLVIYNITSNCLNFYAGSTWHETCGSIITSGTGTFPPGTVHCTNTPTAVVDVLNPTTGKTWMDRNLGASRTARSSTDTASYGDLYQWGRGPDGHQCRNSATTQTLSSTDQPGHGDFILTPNQPNDWRSPQNTNLWQGVNGVNNPCPNGYRIPTETELNAERLSWTSNNAAGAIASPLKLPMAGYRDQSGGWLGNIGSGGDYYSSKVTGTRSSYLAFNSSNGILTGNLRAYGISVRCIKETSQQSGAIGHIDCNNTITTGTLVANTAASGVSCSVPYTGGNGGTHNGQVVISQGVTGLTATLTSGTFSNNAGRLAYSITGTPISSGVAIFTLNIGGQNCTLNLTVNVNIGTGTFPPGTVHCTSTPTAVVDVINPITGETWMDRNLGAAQVATSSADAQSYGDLYQWGRASDGHQCRTSPTTSTLSSTDQPGHGDFITTSTSPNDWRSPQNANLWQGVNGVNNPCPSGYRLPTLSEIYAELTSWSSNNAAGAFASPLKLPMAGLRFRSGGSLIIVGTYGNYWSYTVSSTDSRLLRFDSSRTTMNTSSRADGLSVRCIKD